MTRKPRSAPPKLDSTQQTLFDALIARGVGNRSILEIGCGAGRLHQRLLQEGASTAVGIELMAEQVDRARAASRRDGLDRRTTYVHDDFMNIADQIEAADITILDKVLHCYHDPRGLIRQSAAQAKSVYAVTFPARRPLLAASIRLLGPILSLFLPFRVRFSPPERIREWIREHGLERVYHQETEMWHVEIYERAEAQDCSRPIAPKLSPR